MEERVVDDEELWNGLKKALHGATERFVETRVLEGERLKEDIVSKLDKMLELVEYIEERSPKIVAEYREKLENKVKELLADTQMEEGRKSHVVHMKETLLSDENGIGRKLDFIAQEMNREANTILSKANDLEISNVGIDLKTEIEKV